MLTKVIPPQPTGCHVGIYSVIQVSVPNVQNTIGSVYMVQPVAKYSLRGRLVHNSVALVRERTIPTERPPPVGEVGANFGG